MLEAQRKLAAEKTFRYELAFRAEGGWERPELRLGEPGAEVLLLGTQKTAVDRSVPERAASAAEFSYRLESGGAAIVLSGEARRKDGVHYLSLDRSSTELLPGMDRVKDRWVSSEAAFLSFLFEKKAEAPETRPLKSEDWREWHRALGAVPLFEAVEDLGAAEEGGAAVRRYRVRVRSDVAAALLLRWSELRTGIPAQPGEFAMLRAQVASWGEAEGEVWIGKKDGKFRRIALGGAMPEEFGGAKFSVDVRFDGYGEPVAVEVPEATPLEDVLGPMLFGRLSLSGDRPPPAPAADEESTPALPLNPPSPAPETESDSDGDGLPDAQEFFYGSDAWNPDTDGDGWQDGHEVANGMNPAGPGTLFGFGL